MLLAGGWGSTEPKLEWMLQNSDSNFGTKPLQSERVEIHVRVATGNRTLMTRALEVSLSLLTNKLDW